MSDTASLENCRELFELSGWDVMGGKVWMGVTEESGYVREYRTLQASTCPAYDAGYLLRKLPRYALTFNGQIHWATYESDSSDLDIESWGKTAEDALCKLCIEMIKAGILPISGRD